MTKAIFALAAAIENLADAINRHGAPRAGGTTYDTVVVYSRCDHNNVGGVVGSDVSPRGGGGG